MPPFDEAGPELRHRPDAYIADRELQVLECVTQNRIAAGLLHVYVEYALVNDLGPGLVGNTEVFPHIPSVATRIQQQPGRRPDRLVHLVWDAPQRIQDGIARTQGVVAGYAGEFPATARARNELGVDPPPHVTRQVQQNP